MCHCIFYSLTVSFKNVLNENSDMRMNGEIYVNLIDSFPEYYVKKTLRTALWNTFYHELDDDPMVSYCTNICIMDEKYKKMIKTDCQFRAKDNIIIFQLKDLNEVHNSFHVDIDFIFGFNSYKHYIKCKCKA